jgi:hypothetical protein
MYTRPDGVSSATAWWPSRVRGAGPALPPSESGSHRSGLPRRAAKTCAVSEGGGDFSCGRGVKRQQNTDLRTAPEARKRAGRSRRACGLCTGASHPLYP